MQKKTTPFVLNDETQENAYGFTIPNDGIALEQFESNPVMLNSHNNNIENVIGKWNDVRVEGTKMLADPEFDSEDKEAKKVEGKVERGFVRAASIGVGFYMEDLVYIAGKMILRKCVLKEASIVAIPANAKALRLYDLSTGQLFDVKNLELQLDGLKSNQSITHKKDSMKEIQLSVVVLMALGLMTQPNTAAEIDAAVLKLKDQLDTEKQKVTAAELKATQAETKLSDHMKAGTKSLLDTAITEGKITAEERATFEALPADICIATLAKIPAKSTLADKVILLSTAGSTAEPKTLDELLNLSDTEKTAFKASNPTKYAALLASA